MITMRNASTSKIWFSATIAVTPRLRTQQPHGRNQKPADKHAPEKGKRNTRDTSDIAYPRMRRMYRAFISPDQFSAINGFPCGLKKV